MCLSASNEGLRARVVFLFLEMLSERQLGWGFGGFGGFRFGVFLGFRGGVGGFEGIWGFGIQVQRFLQGLRFLGFEMV